MAISTNKEQLELDKFKDESGVPAIRIVQTTATLTSGLLSANREDNEYAKFVEDDSGNVAIVLIAA